MRHVWDRVRAGAQTWLAPCGGEEGFVRRGDVGGADGGRGRRRQSGCLGRVCPQGAVDEAEVVVGASAVVVARGRAGQGGLLGVAWWTLVYAWRLHAAAKTTDAGALGQSGAG